MINQHLADNSNVGNVNGVNLAGTASDASLALNGAIWKEIYGNDFNLAGLAFNNPNMISDYNNILSILPGNSEVGSAFWFNLPGDRQGFVGITSDTPAPNSLSMCLAFGIFSGFTWYLVRRRLEFLSESQPI